MGKRLEAIENKASGERPEARGKTIKKMENKLRLQATGYRRPTAVFLLTSYFLLLTSYFLLLTPENRKLK